MGLLIQRSSGSSSPYSTSFPSTENPISESGAWSNPNGTGFTNVRTASGNAFGTATGLDIYDDSYAYLTGFTNDHEVEGIIHVGTVPAGNHEVELHLRLSESGGAVSTYEILKSNSGSFQIVRWDAWVGGTGSASVTDLTSLGSGTGHSAAPSNGDELRARIVGQAITVFYNDSQVWTYTDNSAGKLTVGKPGIGFFYRTGDGATPSTFGFQSVVVRDI